ncbi:MAG: helix-turn-helix domain-containing protein [Actinomycetota bacterium]
MLDLDPLTFGRRLRHHRRGAGLTLKELGARVGRPAPYLSMLENGRRTPAPDHIPELAAALGVDPAQLVDPEAPSGRAALEIELERLQARFSHLDLPYIRPSPALSDDILEHLVGLYRVVGPGPGETDGELRAANAATGRWLREQDGYLPDVEAVAGGILKAVGHGGQGPVSSRTLLDIASHLGYDIQAVEDMVPGARSITDRRTGRIYIAQRNELRTRQARKAILQTLAGDLLGHRDPPSSREFLRQRVETAYLAAAVLVPQTSVVARLRAARERRDLTIEDIKEMFYVSYEMAAWRFVNLATHHLGIRSHLVVTRSDGLVVKGYGNDDVPFVTDSEGGVEAQQVCRRWGAAAVFDSEDKFDVHAQYTDTPAGMYLCVTHLEPDRPYAITVGVPARSARWFRERGTPRRAESRCPDPACCRLPSPAQLRRREGQVEVSVRSQDRLLGRLAPDPYPSQRDRRVYDLVERHE